MKAKITYEIIVDLNPEHYPEGSTNQNMLDIELRNAAEDDAWLFTILDTSDFKITGKLL